MIGKSKVNVKPDEYHVGNLLLPSGLCLFKVLVQEAHLESNDTSGMIRKILSDLDRKIQEIGNEIIQLKPHVQMLLGSFKARG